MIKNIKLKSHSLFLFIGFLISIYCISIVISISYKLYKSYDEENKYNQTLSLFTQPLEKAVTMKDFTKSINNLGVNNIMTDTMSNIINIGDSFYSGNVQAIDFFIDFNTYGKLAGNNLTRSNIENGDKVAVIGEKMLDAIQKIDNKNYISVFGDSFEVIGVIHGNDYLRTRIFVPLRGLKIYNNEYQNFRFLCMISDKPKLTNLGDNVTFTDIPKVDITKMLSKKIPELKDTIYSVLLGIINTILFSIFFAVSLKRNVAIMKVLGATNLDVLKYVFSKILKIYSLSLVFGLLLSHITSLNMTKIFTYGLSPLNLYNVSITTGITLILLVLITLITLTNILRFNLIKEIR